MNIFDSALSMHMKRGDNAVKEEAERQAESSRMGLIAEVGLAKGETARRRRTIYRSNSEVFPITHAHIAGTTH